MTNHYSRSLRFGLRDGSLESNPKINNETKKIIDVYTKSFKINIEFFLETSFNNINYTKI